MNKKAFDVAILGSGPVGSMLSLALASSKWLKNILLIERQKVHPIELPIVPDQRVYSITESSTRAMHSLGIKLQQNRTGCIKEIKVFKDRALLHFEREHLSDVVENNHILNKFLQKISAQPSITIMDQVEVEGFDIKGSHLNLKFKNGEQIQTKLLVGSDGNKSKVKELAKIATYGWNYGQMGLVCTLKLDRNITTAYQRYYDGHTLAILPLWN